MPGTDAFVTDNSWQSMDGSNLKLGAGYFLAGKVSTGVRSECREHIICPVFVARDLSGLGWSLKEGHYDTGEVPTGGETDAVRGAL